MLFFIRTINSNDELRNIKKQLGRCSSSDTANYRAACRAGSDKAFYSKMCIVVEVAVQTLFWLEVIEKTQGHNAVNFRKL